MASVIDKYDSRQQFSVSDYLSTVGTYHTTKRQRINNTKNLQHKSGQQVLSIIRAWTDKPTP